jgi:8-oxo-dGTP pyrophosphatase MutT (NUDIX family)
MTTSMPIIHHQTECQITSKFVPKQNNITFGGTTATNSNASRSLSSLNKPYTPHPITSYGIILTCKKTGRFLISQRRDTIEYTEFIRGKVSKSLYKVYFSQMTKTERSRLTTYTFSQLWDDLWVNHSNRIYRDMYATAKAKFDENKLQLPKLLEAYPSDVLQPIWGFPKGKLNFSTEKHEKAAMREFIEETNIDIDYRNLLDIPAVTETFLGTNGKTYSTTYLVSSVDSEVPIKYTTSNCMRPNTVSEEISDLKWVTVEESKEYLNERRQELLRDLEIKLGEYYARTTSNLTHCHM